MSLACSQTLKILKYNHAKSRHGDGGTRGIMRYFYFKLFTVLIFVVLVTTLSSSLSQKMIAPAFAQPVIADWIKNIFIWYGQGLISDSELIEALQFLIDNDELIVDSKTLNKNPTNIALML